MLQTLLHVKVTVLCFPIQLKLILGLSIIRYHHHLHGDNKGYWSFEKAGTQGCSFVFFLWWSHPITLEPKSTGLLEGFTLSVQEQQT